MYASICHQQKYISRHCGWTCDTLHWIRDIAAIGTRKTPTVASIRGWLRGIYKPDSTWRERRPAVDLTKKNSRRDISQHARRRRWLTIDVAMECSPGRDAFRDVTPIGRVVSQIAACTTRDLRLATRVSLSTRSPTTTATTATAVDASPYVARSQTIRVAIFRSQRRRHDRGPICALRNAAAPDSWHWRRRATPAAKYRRHDRVFAASFYYSISQT